MSRFSVMATCFLASVWLMAWTAIAGCDPLERPDSKPLVFGVALDGLPLDVGRIRQAEAETGLPVRMVNFFLQWPAEPASGGFPRSSVDAVQAAGAVPCVTWEPMFIRDGEEFMVAAEDILSGRWDVYIDAFAASAREWGGALLVRFAHEMNLARYHWGTGPGEYGPESPKLYRAMFRHVAGRFRAMGAHNAGLVFCPNAESVPGISFDPDAGWNTISAYWPGREHVAVLGVDGYNWGDTRTMEKHGWQSSFRSFADIFGPAHEELVSLAPDLPLVVFETASAASGGDKAAWIREAFATAGRWRLAGLAWFHADKEVDWRMQTGAGQGWIDGVLPLVDGEIDPGRALGLDEAGKGITP